jgi:ADP-dependent NAD(P)H-hydrate dehydratase / NAD(P)H-hydrate epimerase
VLANPARSSWPATAGSGDVLTGVIGALLAAGLDPATAAVAATHVQELAATLAAAASPAGACWMQNAVMSGAPAPASAIQEGLTAAIRIVRAEARR